MAQRKEKVSGHTIVISNKFYILYNFDNDDEDNDKNTQKTTKKVILLTYMTKHKMLKLKKGVKW